MVALDTIQGSVEYGSGAWARSKVSCHRPLHARGFGAKGLYLKALSRLCQLRLLRPDTSVPSTPLGRASGLLKPHFINGAREMLSQVQIQGQQLESAATGLADASPRGGNRWFDRE